MSRNHIPSSLPPSSSSAPQPSPMERGQGYYIKIEDTKDIMQVDGANKPQHSNQFRVITVTESGYNPSVTHHPSISVPSNQHTYYPIYHANTSPPTTPTSDDVIHLVPPFSYGGSHHGSGANTGGTGYYSSQISPTALPPILYHRSPVSSPTTSMTPQPPFGHHHQMSPPQTSSGAPSSSSHPPISGMKVKIPPNSSPQPTILISPRDVPPPTMIPAHYTTIQPSSMYQYSIDNPMNYNIYHPPSSSNPQPHQFTFYSQIPPSSPLIQEQSINSSSDHLQIPPPPLHSHHSPPLSSSHHIHHIPSHSPTASSTPVHPFTFPSQKPPHHYHNPGFPTSTSTPTLSNPNLSYFGANKMYKKSNTVVPLLSKLPTNPPPPLSPKSNPNTPTTTTTTTSTSNNSTHVNNQSNSSTNNNGGVNSSTTSPLSNSSSSVQPSPAKKQMMFKHQSLPLLPLPQLNCSDSSINYGDSSGSGAGLGSNHNPTTTTTASSTGLHHSTSSGNLNSSHDSIDAPLTPMSSPSISSLSLNTPSISPLSTPPITPPLYLSGSSPQHSPRNPNSPRYDQHNQLQIFKKQYESLLTKSMAELWETVESDTKMDAQRLFKNLSVPLARVKKIMKLDPAVKMISADTPIIFVKACEIFILELTTRAWVHTEMCKRKTLTRADMIHAIARVETFDFLVDIVSRDEIKPKKFEDPSKSTFLNSPEGFHYLQYLQLQSYLQDTRRSNSIRIESNYHNPRSTSGNLKNSNPSQTTRSSSSTVPNSGSQMATINEEYSCEEEVDDNEYVDEI